LKSIYNDARSEKHKKKHRVSLLLGAQGSKIVCTQNVTVWM